MLKLASNESYLVKLLQAISKAEPRSLDDMLIDAFENFLTTFSSHDLPIDCEVALINILLSLISDSQTTQKMKLSHLIARILKYYTNPLKVTHFLFFPLLWTGTDCLSPIRPVAHAERDAELPFTIVH